MGNFLSMKKGIAIAVATAVVTSIFWLFAGLQMASPAQEQNVSYEKKFWQRYESSLGFSFMYPKGYKVSEGPADENAGQSARSIYITQVDDNGQDVQGPPVMFINIFSPHGPVEFSLWEGIDWRYFKDVIHSIDLQPGQGNGGPSGV